MVGTTGNHDHTVASLMPKLNDISGERLAASGEPITAAQHHQRAVEAQPNDSEQWSYKSLALIRLGRWDEAEAPLRHLLTVEPTHVDGSYYLARLLIDRDRLAEAIAVLTPAIEAARDRFEAFAPLVVELCNRGVKAAEALLQRMAEHEPHDIIANFLLGEHLLAAGRPAAGDTYLQRAAGGQPTHSSQWLYKSLALERLKRFDESEGLIRHFLALQPNHAHGKFCLARLLMDRDRLAEAIAVLTPAIEAAPERYEAFAPLVMELTLRGVKEAKPLLQRIVEPNFTNAKAMLDLAKMAFYYAIPELAADYIARARVLADSPMLRISDDMLLPLVLSTTEDIERWVERFRTRVIALKFSGIRICDPLQPIIQPPHYLPFCWGLNTREICVVASRAWQTICPQLNWTAPHCEKRNTSPLTRRLRVGFLTQPTFPLVWGIARELDREHFEVVHLFEQSQQSTSTCEWHGVSDRQVSIPDRSLPDAQRAIADQELDILIHMPYTGLRYFLSHARLAPVQCVLCEPNYTDSVPNSDYYISWSPAEPKNLEKYYSGAVALMARPPYWVERDYTKPAALQRADFDLPQDARWYLYPGTALKMHPKFDAVLSEILADA